MADKNRKYDRQRAWCQAYKQRRQRDINRAVRLLRHLRRIEKRAAIGATARDIERTRSFIMQLPVLRIKTACQRVGWAGDWRTLAGQGT